MTAAELAARFSRRYERPHAVVEALATLEAELRSGGLGAAVPLRGPRGERRYPLPDGDWLVVRADVPGLRIDATVQAKHDSR